MYARLSSLFCRPTLNASQTLVDDLVSPFALYPYANRARSPRDQDDRAKLGFQPISPELIKTMELTLNHIDITGL